MHPPLIILTLKDNVERRTRLLSTLESQGVPYELWFAVDGRSGLPQKYERLVDRQQIFKNLRRNMGDAEIACALSHHLTKSCEKIGIQVKHDQSSTKSNQP